MTSNQTKTGGSQKKGIHAEIWNFPCEHAIKVMGYSQYDLASVTCHLLDKLDVTYDPQSLKTKKSSQGKYVSITLKVSFNSKTDVEETFSGLSACEEVIWAL